MISRRSLIAGIALAAGLATLPAKAAEPFTTTAFEAAQAAGKPILVEVFASWCSTCRAQQPIIADISGRPEFADVIVLKVDFDDQKDIVRALGAQMQSTLIAYRGATEVGRTVGDTNPASIEALVRSAI